MQRYSLSKKIYTVEGIGRVIIAKRKTNKRLSIRVTMKHISVTIPWYCSFQEAEKFVNEKKEWIKNATLQFSRQFSLLDHQQINFVNGSIDIFMHEHQHVHYINQANNHIKVFIPSTIQNSQIIDVENKLRKYIKEKAKQYLNNRTQYLAQIHGFHYSKIRISAAVTRWGSCSYKNNINLNYRLMFLPSYLIDYVILHELTHTVHKNHKSEFWSLLNSIYHGNARELSHELKSYRIHNML